MSFRAAKMAGKANKGKNKGKGKPDSGSVASKEVQPLTSATGLPELVLRKAPAVPAAVDKLAVEAPEEVVAEALTESREVKTASSLSEKTEPSGRSEAGSDDAKSKPEEAETRDVNGDGEADGEADGDGKALMLLTFPILNVRLLVEGTGLLYECSLDHRRQV